MKNLVSLSFIKLSLLLFCLTGFSALPYAQNSAKNGSGEPSQLEKEVVAELNLARTQPKAYARIIADFSKYFKGKDLYIPGEITLMTNEGISAANEAIKYLNSQSPLPPLTISKGLWLASKDMVRMQEKTNQIGHKGTDGSSPTTRISRHGDWDISAAENIDYGNSNARRIVISLIVDDGVSSRGHRKNIFTKEFRMVGVACGGHQTYHYMCVMDFAGSFKDK